MKKTLALVLALALVFSSITVAFAEGTIGAEAQICADLGMLKGETGTVDAAYVATAPTRLQSAVMFLRLKGLEAEALAFNGGANFADGKMAWAEGSNLLAYLKANPQLGWVGDGTNFNPNGKITAKEYYKVLLETLGYKQNTAEVVGDFTWDNVVEFAAGKGLSKVAAVTSYTVNDLAIATVEALKANVKEGGKTLVATLVEAGKIDAAKATAAGLFEEVVATDAKLDAVVASANDKVEVTFDADAAKAFAENAANYKIVVKGSTTALEVKSAKAVNSTIVELTTAVQTGGTAYTMTVGNVSKNFAGLAKKTGAPELDTVKCIDTNTVEVVFKTAMDRTSVEDAANYTLSNGATVKAAELWIDQDDSRMTVKLTTEGVANNKVYKLTVANVKSADLTSIKTLTKSFTGITDTTAPKISTVSVVNNQRIFVVFEDKHGVDKATAQNIANWSIDGLTINSIKAQDYIDCNGKTYGLKDDYNYLDAVEINTEPMTPSHKYTLTINNMIDGSSSKNAIAKALTKTFYGVAADKSAPKVGTIDVLGDNIVEVQFSDTNRLDYATATDVNNYTFNEGLQVLSASILRPSKPDDGPTGKLVVLKTSTMDTATTYKISIANVADEFGNVMTPVNNRNIKRSNGQDIAPPAVKKVTWNDKNTVVVEFNEKLDIDSANDPTNYVLNNDLGAVKKAEISGGSAYTKVTLTTPDMTTNKNYTITITGVKDRVGNEMFNYKAYFTAGQTSVDTDAPEVENIVAINKNEVQITFNEAVVADPDATLTLRTVDSHGNIASSNFTTAKVQGIGRADYTIDDNTTVAFYLNSDNLSESQEYVVYGLTKIKDAHNNSYKVASSADDRDTFYGSSDTQDDLEVVGVDEINMKKLQVTFSRPVVFGTSYKGTTDATGVIDHKKTLTGGWTLTIDKDNDQTTDALSVVTFEKNTVMKADVEIPLNLNGITDYVGTQVASSDRTYKYTPYLDDTDAPVIDYVEAVSTKKVQVHYNESMFTGGTYSIKGIMKGRTTESTLTLSGVVDGDDDTIVNLDVNGQLKEGEVYTLIPKTSAKDIAENSSSIKDVSFEFVASTVVMNDYIKGVAIIDGATVQVRATAALSNVEILKGSVVISGTPRYSSDFTKATLTLTEPLMEDTTYSVSATGFEKYNFNGILVEGGLDIDEDIISFSDWNAQDYSVYVVVYSNSTGYTVTNIAAPTAADAVGFDASATIGAFAPNTEYIVEVYRIVDGDEENAPIYARVFKK